MGVLAQLPTAARRRGGDTLSTADGGAQARRARIAHIISKAREDQAEPSQRLIALGDLRQELAATQHPPIQDLLELGGLEVIVGLLDSSSAAVQLEASWCLTNAASGTSAQTTALVDAGAVDGLFKILLSPSAANAELCDQCLWALGNIASDGDVALRDRLLAAGVVSVLGQLYQRLPSMAWGSQDRTQALRTLTWLMSSLCRGKPAPPLEEVECAFDYFVQVCAGTDDPQMLSEALWGLCYLLEGATSEKDSAARAMRMLEVGFAPGEAPRPPAVHPAVAQAVRCMRLSGNPKNPTPVPALRLLGVMVRVPSPEVTDAVLAAGALPALRDTLVDLYAPVQVRRDAAWALANVAAGTDAQAERLLDDSGVWDTLCEVLEEGRPEVRCECAWAVANVAKRGPPTAAMLDSAKILRLATLAVRVETDPELQRALLDAVEVLLRYSSRQANGGSLWEVADEIGLLEVLEDLQLSGQESIHCKAEYLIEAWLGANRENVPPQAKKATKGSMDTEMDMGPARATGICDFNVLCDATTKSGLASQVGGGPASLRPGLSEGHAAVNRGPMRSIATQFGA